MTTQSNVDVVLGAQWGDEGKGRIVSALCLTGKYDWCVKVNGSDNAGHTVVLPSGDEIAFQQVPIGVIYGLKGVIARGCIVSLPKLELEITRIEESARLNELCQNWIIYLDTRCHIKTEEHLIRDAQEERDRKHPIGTTLSGNGPAHADKYARRNLRVGDIDLSGYPHIMKRILPCDTSAILHASQGDILVEGAHGVMLDIDHGTYPFVSSSGCTAAYACHSMGIAPSRIRRVIGVIKPYVTRVGAGAFPTEMRSKLQNILRKKGHEYGTVTQRPRRIGWLDIPALRYAIRISGIMELALAKLDVFDNWDGSVQICTGYSGNGGELLSDRYIPSRDEDYSAVGPIYFPIAWTGNGNKHLMQLIEDRTRTPIHIISRGLKVTDINMNVKAPY